MLHGVYSLCTYGLWYKVFGRFDSADAWPKKNTFRLISICVQDICVCVSICFTSIALKRRRIRYTHGETEKQNETYSHIQCHNTDG